MQHDAAQRELAFGEAEGTYNERLATLLNALRSLPRGRVDRLVATLVLRVFESTAGATRPEGVALSYEEIADQTAQGLWSSDDTAKRVVRRCEELGLLVRSESRRGGRQGKNVYWIAVRQVCEMAGGICRSAARSPEPQIAPPPPQIAPLAQQPLNRAQARLQQVFATMEAKFPGVQSAALAHCTNEEQEILPRYQSNEMGLVLGTSAGPRQALAGVATALVESIERASDPAEQKRRLVARITAVVADPRMGGHIARAAADLVVHHGVPIQELETILADIEAMRGAGSLLVPGAFFHSKARGLAGRHGKPWPRAKTNVKGVCDENGCD